MFDEMRPEDKKNPKYLYSHFYGVQVHLYNLGRIVVDFDLRTMKWYIWAQYTCCKIGLKKYRNKKKAVEDAEILAHSCGVRLKVYD